MRCELCGVDPDLIISLPIHQPDGRYNTMACWQCAIQSVAYCVHHNTPHMGFEDGTHACQQCIEDEVESLKPVAGRYLRFFYDNLPADQYKLLYEWAVYTGRDTMDPAEICVLRAVICLSKRTGHDKTRVVYNIFKSKSIDSLVPVGIAQLCEDLNTIERSLMN